MSDAQEKPGGNTANKWQSLYAQIVFVVVAFTLMVFVSYLFMRNIEQGHLERQTEDYFTGIESLLYADIREFETMLSDVSQTVRGMLVSGYDLDVIKQYLVEMTEYNGEGGKAPGFLTFFAFFGEEALDGFNALDPDLDWDALYAQGFVTKERPWYIAAQTSGTETVTTDAYVDVMTKEVTFTYVRNIFDDEGKRLAIVCLDVLLNRIYEFSLENRGSEGYDWMLGDKNHVIIAHRNTDFLGMTFSEINSPLTVFVDELRREGSISNGYMRDYWGRPAFFTIRPIDNGWLLGIVTYADSYYAGLYSILFFLVALGTVLAASLVIILVRINKAKEKADERAHESEERTRVMLESTPLGAHFWDLDNYRIIDCNQAALRLFGLADKQEYYKRYLEFTPEYQPDGTLSKVKRDESITKAAREGKYVLEWMFKTSDGEPLPCEATLVRADQSGKNVISYFRDLREEKKMLADMQNAIEEKTALTHMNNILNGVDAMICVTDPETDEILFINDTMRQIYGTVDDYTGEKCYNLLHGLDSRCENCPCVELSLNPGREIIWEQRSTALKRIFRSCSKYIMWPNGKLVHIQHAMDVTDMKKAEREIELKNQQLQVALLNEEKANKAKSLFLANMSHEIRTPMNAILGITELQLRNESLPTEMEEGLEQIYDSGNLLLNIINDILDLSKIEAGKMEILPAKYDVPSLINDTVQLNRMRYENKPIELVLDIEPKTPLNLVGDELRIKQVLNNILSNAFKYTDKGKVGFSVSILSPGDEKQATGSKPAIPFPQLFPEYDESDVVLVITISDTGHGMTKEELDMLFDEYSRFNLEANRKIVGTGLGMSITKRLLALMGGEISVESEVGKGTTFTVVLPQRKVNSFVCGNEVVENLRSFHYHGTSMSKKSRMLREYMPYGNVLVVDDVESNIYVTRGMLVPYGLHIDTTNSGAGAIEKVKAGNEYDIIFMDHMMPGMDGIETVKNLRGMGYAGTIIALTANALVGQAEMFFQNGFDGYMSKPIDSRELNHTLNEHIRNKKPPSVINEARRMQRQKQAETAQRTDPAQQAKAQPPNKKTKETPPQSSKKTPPQKSGETPPQSSAHTQPPDEPKPGLSELEEFFIMDAEAAVSTLEEMLSKEGEMNGEDIETYEITVHGIKSALLNIGRAELSASALNLEKAAKANDLETIRAETPTLINNLKTLLTDLKSRA